MACVVAGAIALGSARLCDLLHAPTGAAVLSVLCITIPLSVAAGTWSALLARDLEFKIVASAGSWSATISSAIAVILILNGVGLWTLVIAEVSRVVIRLVVLVSSRIYFPAFPSRGRRSTSSRPSTYQASG